MAEISNAGTVCSWLHLPWPWPPKEAVTLISRRLDGFNLRVRAEPDCLIHAALFENEKPILIAASCPIALSEPAFVFLGVAWSSLKTMRIVVNDTQVADLESPSSAADSYSVPKRMAPTHPAEDFSRQNATCIIKRRERVRGTRPIKNRVAGLDVDAQLREEALQVRDLINWVRNGYVHHARGLAGRVRILISDGKLPLLQRAAGTVNAPLIVYTSAQPHTKIPLEPNAHVMLDISAMPSAPYTNPIDLDAWLELDGMSVGGRTFTHREVVRVVGNYGAHSDPELEPLVAFLLSTGSGVTGGKERDLFVEYVLQIASAVLRHADDILSRG
jgi:hypothetical protein